MDKTLKLGSSLGFLSLLWYGLGALAIHSLAALSIVVLAAVILISIFNKQVNAGFPAITAALLLGTIGLDMTASKVFASFLPTSLLMILVGTSAYFEGAVLNGTMDKLARHAVRLCGNRVILVPIMLVLSTCLISSAGAGNIITTVIMSPFAVAVAKQIGLNPFGIGLATMGAASGGTISPLAETGIVSNTLIEKMADPLGFNEAMLHAIGLQNFVYCLVSLTAIGFFGFLFFGGWSWYRVAHTNQFSIDAIAPKPEPLTKAQWQTVIAGLFIFGAVLVGIYLPIPQIKLIISNIGAVCLFAATILFYTGAFDSKETLKGMSWGVIILVCFFAMLVGVMEKTGGLSALVGMISTGSQAMATSSISASVIALFLVGLITGIISAYGSSTGVVIPMFMPMVVGLHQQLGCDIHALIYTILICALIVDASPLSTLGAVTLSSMDEYWPEKRGEFFSKMMIWGLTMAPVGAIFCAVMFGILKIGVY